MATIVRAERIGGQVHFVLDDQSEFTFPPNQVDSGLTDADYAAQCARELLLLVQSQEALKAKKLTALTNVTLDKDQALVAVEENPA